MMSWEVWVVLLFVAWGLLAAAWLIVGTSGNRRDDD